MPRLAKPLTALAVEKARPRDTPYALPSGDGLSLCVAVSGQKSWKVRYRLQDGRQRTIVIGNYPAMGLADARAQTREVHLAAQTGAPIIGLRAEVKAAQAMLSAEELAAQEAAKEAHRHSFNVLSEKWLAVRQPGWADESCRKAKYVVRTYLQAGIGDLDMRTLRTRDVTDTLRNLAVTAPSLAKKAVQYLNGVVDYCILEGIRDDDQVLRLRGVLPSHRGGHIPAVTHERDIGPLMRSIHEYEGHVVLAPV